MSSDDDHDNRLPFLHHHRQPYDFNNRIMLTAIISLSVVVVFIAILHIYARFVLRRQARRRAALRHLGIITTAAHMHSSIDTPKTGLDPSVIASLPLFVFKQTESTSLDLEMGPNECSVCLSILEDGDRARILPNCNHTFHADCIDRWLVSNSTCPICRSEAEPKPTASAPPLLMEPVANAEGTSTSSSGDGAAQSTAKIGGSSSRLSSFRRMLSGERPSRRTQPPADGTDQAHDLERQ